MSVLLSNEPRSDKVIGVIQEVLPNNKVTVLFDDIIPFNPTPKLILFSNNDPIDIGPDMGDATPYPSCITVPEQCGLIGDFPSSVQVTLDGFRHQKPMEVEILLVGPDGTKCMIMGRVGGIEEVGFGQIILIIFSDGALNEIPTDSFPENTLSFKPSCLLCDFNGSDVSGHDLPKQLSIFNGMDAQGDWCLYVYDSSISDGGNLINGWTITFILTQSLISGKDYFIKCFSGTNLKTCLTPEPCDSQNCRRRCVGTACDTDTIVWNLEPPLCKKCDEGCCSDVENILIENKTFIFAGPVEDSDRIVRTFKDPKFGIGVDGKRSPWFSFGRDSQGALVMGEDAWFSNVARDAGYSTWIDPTFKVLHCGEYLF